MDVWMLNRKILPNDLLDIFSALGNLQAQYDWVITDHSMWYGKNCPEAVCKRWQWTGLLMSGRELTEHLSAGYVWFLDGAVLSAVPLGMREEDVNLYEPVWDVDFCAPDYRFQTPLTRLELILFDGWAWVIVCNAAFSKLVQSRLPQAQPPDAFLRRLDNSGRAPCVNPSKAGSPVFINADQALRSASVSSPSQNQRAIK